MYQAFISFKGQSHSVNVPVSYAVMKKLQPKDLPTVIEGHGGDALYGNGHVGGGFDMANRYNHHGKHHAHAAVVEIRHHGFDALNPARHGSRHVVLIAVVDAHIGIGGPNQNRIDTAIALLQIIEIAVHRVFVRHRIVEIAVLHHHLRLDEARLRPGQRRIAIARIVIAGADVALCRANAAHPSASPDATAPCRARAPARRADPRSFPSAYSKRPAESAGRWAGNWSPVPAPPKRAPRRSSGRQSCTNG